MTTLTDRDLIALTIYGEARGELVEGKIAVACVLRNRLRVGKWGASYERVCRAPKQFSCWNLSDPNAAVLKRLTTQIQQGLPPTDPALLECYWIADGLMKDLIQPRVGDATHYCARSMPTPPAWARDGELVATVGHHWFFENVP